MVVLEGLFDQAFAIGAARIAGGVAEDGVFVVQGATAELLNARWMDAVELAVAIAADGEEASDFVSLQPGEKLVRLVLEAAEIGVTAFLVLAVRHLVRRAMSATFREPNLQVPADAMSARGQCFGGGSPVLSEHLCPGAVRPLL